MKQLYHLVEPALSWFERHTTKTTSIDYSCAEVMLRKETQTGPKSFSAEVLYQIPSLEMICGEWGRWSTLWMFWRIAIAEKSSKSQHKAEGSKGESVRQRKGRNNVEDGNIDEWTTNKRLYIKIRYQRETSLSLPTDSTSSQTKTSLQASLFQLLNSSSSCQK